MTNIETAGEPVRKNRLRSAISGKEIRRRDLFSLDTLRPSLVDRIRQDHPDLAPDALISRDELAHYRTLYVEEMLKAEHGDLTDLDRQVAESIAKHDTLAENVEEEFDEQRTLGERLSDVIASFGGSWSFIILFGLDPWRLDGLQPRRAGRPTGSTNTPSSCSIWCSRRSPRYRRRSS